MNGLLDKQSRKFSVIASPERNAPHSTKDAAIAAQQTRRSPRRPHPDKSGFRLLAMTSGSM